MFIWQNTPEMIFGQIVGVGIANEFENENEQPAEAMKTVAVSVQLEQFDQKLMYNAKVQAAIVEESIPLYRWCTRWIGENFDW